MSIRSLIMLVIGALAAVVLASTLWIAADAWTRHRGTQLVAETNPVSDQLLSAAGHWAVERGATTAALAAAEPAAAGALDLIAGLAPRDNGSLRTRMSEAPADRMEEAEVQASIRDLPRLPPHMGDVAPLLRRRRCAGPGCDEELARRAQREPLFARGAA